MQRQTIEKILSERKISKSNGAYTIPEEQVASLLIGQGQTSVLGGVVKLTLGDDVLMIESKKGAQSYLEYDILRAISFELREIADRHAGFF